MERVRSHPAMRAAVENLLTASNVGFNGYRQLDQFKQAGLSEARSPQEEKGFSTIVRELFDGRVRESLNVSEVFKFSAGLPQEYDSLAFVVSRKDLRRIEEAMHKARVGGGVGGTPKPHDAFGSVGGFYLVPLKGKKEISEDGRVAQAVFPRAIAEPRGDGSLLAIDSQNLVRVSPKGKVESLRGGVVGFPHSIEVNNKGTRAVVTNSGTDTVMRVTTKRLKVKGVWHAYDHGFNLSIGYGQRRYVCYEDNYDPSLVPEGFEVILVDRANPVHFPPALQTTHVNSSILDPKDEKEKVLMTIFAHRMATKKGETIEQEGTGGKILRAGWGDSGNEVLVDGLNNPHDLTYLGDDLYMVANTSSGELQFFEDDGLEWQLFGKLVFDEGLTEPALREHPWIMAVNFTESTDGARQFISLDDSQRKVVHVLEFNKRLGARRRWSIPYPYDWGIQNVWYVGKD